MARTEKESSLQNTYTFKNFVQAIQRMQQVGEQCEKINHHPTRTNTYNTVTIELSTHDAGNSVTEKDQRLAQIMDEIYSQYNKKK